MSLAAVRAIIRAPCCGFDLPRHLDAIHHGHHDIGHDDIRMVGIEEFEAALPFSATSKVHLGNLRLIRRVTSSRVVWSSST